jgi:HD-like signal output (HDOD) protein
MFALPPSGPKFTPGTITWGESVEQERQLFGVDHCVVGKCIGLSWNFSPEIIDVLEHHHRPLEARQDGVLVEMVGAADLVCQMHGVRVGGEPSRIALADQNAYKNLLDSCAPSLTDEEKTALAKILEGEFPDIVRSLELRVAAIWG